MMTDKKLPNAGVGAGATVAATLVGVLSNLVGFIPTEYQDSWVKMVPYLSPIIAWALIRLYNYFLEPEELASARRKLERDLKALKKVIKDSTLTDDEKKPFRADYLETQRLLARLGRDYNGGYLSLGKTDPL
ncbi:MULTISPECIES: hypothetical protein [Kluyvera]|uniref:hypothetical protein n=1 Tax=Kluyvera TaxID=579 RepID=UPI002DB81AD9|nr:hypothetical protein [Kluyvera cryocrescens]MEB6631808.1 hypothetical protein [Kluyvera cryocrescens]